jgi:hypothetical protein
MGEMKSLYLMISVMMVLSSCTAPDHTQVTDYDEVITDTYQLVQPNTSPSAVLVLFGGFPETAQSFRG